jgi:hypothetical protein
MLLAADKKWTQCMKAAGITGNCDPNNGTNQATKPTPATVSQTTVSDDQFMQIFKQCEVGIGFTSPITEKTSYAAIMASIKGAVARAGRNQDLLQPIYVYARIVVDPVNSQRYLNLVRSGADPNLTNINVEATTSN